MESTHKPSHKPRKLVLTILIPIRWGDMDAYGHVNNTLYFRYMEQARVEYLESNGYPIIPKGTAPVIINASCTFLIPLTYPGNVEVKMFFGAPGRSSIPSSYEIRLQGDDTLYATGDSKIVWTDMESGKSVPIPEDLRALLSEM
ncbi:acyl-CoA thioesterase [Propionivibrio sp.]|uniref:acyl-CoA thioesterase n=1 Tax=Propionivibrio sp. TaxID=2212460 RepID=UPI003BF21E91